MGIENVIKGAPVGDRVRVTETLYNEAELGASAETVLRALDPLIERRLGLLLDQLAICVPELGPLLDIRAKISEVWRIRKDLASSRDKGRKSWESLQSILADFQSSNGKEQM